MDVWGAGSAEEPGSLGRHAQGCVERLRGLEEPNVPLSTPTGGQLAPTSPKLVEGEFYELRLVRLLRSPSDARPDVVPKEVPRSPQHTHDETCTKDTVTQLKQCEYGEPRPA